MFLFVSAVASRVASRIEKKLVNQLAKLPVGVQLSSFNNNYVDNSN